MSDYDRPTSDAERETAQRREVEMTGQTGDPVGTYERPERSGAGMLTAVVVLVVLALLVFLLIQFVF